MQETVEAQPEEANISQPSSYQTNDTFDGEDNSGAFDEPVADEEGTSPEADAWEDRSTSKQMLDDPWQSEDPTEVFDRKPRTRTNFTSTALYRFLTNRKLEDADDEQKS